MKLHHLLIYLYQNGLSNMIQRLAVFILNLFKEGVGPDRTTFWYVLVVLCAERGRALAVLGVSRNLP